LFVNLPRADWLWALIAASGLEAAAAFIVFVIRPGGFEGQIGWFIGLMPGALLWYLLADHVRAIPPAVEPILIWGSVLGITFLWYFAISYVLIKAYRLVARLWT
jgi:hypothetical protein